MPQRLPPTDPREWLRKGRSDLALARSRPEDVELEDLCFHAQQAAEKAIKAVFIHRGAEFHYIHDLASLLTQLEATGQVVPEAIRQCEALTRFAVLTRYPGIWPDVEEDEWRAAVAMATKVTDWAEAIVRETETEDPS